VLNVCYDYNDYSGHLESEEASTMNAQTWTVAQAKAKFSEVIDRAGAEGPQTITRNGRTAVVVVDAGEWQRKTKRVGTLTEFLAKSPLREGGLKLPRRTRPRRVDL
jgi:prevent-host-death family protein